MTYIVLNTLPEDHPLRNTPLGELDAEYRWYKAADTAQWRTVRVGAPKLIPHTFNELGTAWTTWDIWRVKHG